jgi:hypothetical protein
MAFKTLCFTCLLVFPGYVEEQNGKIHGFKAVSELLISGTA